MKATELANFFFGVMAFLNLIGMVDVYREIDDDAMRETVGRTLTISLLLLAATVIILIAYK